MDARADLAGGTMALRIRLNGIRMLKVRITWRPLGGVARQQQIAGYEFSRSYPTGSPRPLAPQSCFG